MQQTNLKCTVSISFFQPLLHTVNNCTMYCMSTIYIADDVELNEAKTKSTHEYEVPPDVNHSLNSEGMYIHNLTCYKKQCHCVLQIILTPHMII